MIVLSTKCHGSPQREWTFPSKTAPIGFLREARGPMSLQTARWRGLWADPGSHRGYPVTHAPALPGVGQRCHISQPCPRKAGRGLPKPGAQSPGGFKSFGRSSQNTAQPQIILSQLDWNSVNPHFPRTGDWCLNSGSGEEKKATPVQLFPKS